MAISTKQQALENPLCLPVEDAARVLSISTAMVRKLVKEGKLPAVRMGRRLLIAYAEIEKFVEGLRVR